MNFIVYFISINIFTFFLCALDKWKAVRHRWRVPEKILLFSGLCGCFGMFASMMLFHHKTKKLKFKLVYLFCVIWVGIIWTFRY